MDRVEWNDAYAIGIGTLDHQHKKLFELVNLFLETLHSQTCQSLVGPVLWGLLAYAKSHFTDEEAVMQKIDYPEMAAHQAEHQSFRRQVEETLMRLNQHQTVDPVKLANFLKTWLTEHISVEDARISCYVNHKQCAHS